MVNEGEISFPFINQIKKCMALPLNPSSLPHSTKFSFNNLAMNDEAIVHVATELQTAIKSEN